MTYFPRIINLERYHKISKSESVEKYLNTHAMLNKEFLVTEQDKCLIPFCLQLLRRNECLFGTWIMQTLLYQTCTRTNFRQCLVMEWQLFIIILLYALYFQELWLNIICYCCHWWQMPLGIVKVCNQQIIICFPRSMRAKS